LVIEVAKEFTAGRAKFYYEEEWRKMIKIHGNISSIMRRGAP